MSTFDLYAVPASLTGWEVRAHTSSRFSWEYDDRRDQLLTLYQRGKAKQWDSEVRIDWDLAVDPDDPLRLPEEMQTLYGTPVWDRMNDRERRELGRHGLAWQFSQFLHGEQGALICSSRITETVPDIDAKFYAATQVMDEARHAETYARFLKDKMGLCYPINEQLRLLLEDTISDSRWDFSYLGMQVLIEGLGLAAFGLLRDSTQETLPKQILTYVMQDEARHVAFGRLALRDHYRQLTSVELAEREEFVIQGCHLMRNRLRGEEIWEYFGLPMQETLEAVENSVFLRSFRELLFSRIVPCIRDIGLWSPRMRDTFADLGVDNLVDADLDVLMRADEDKAAVADRARRWGVEEAERMVEVRKTIALGTESVDGGPADGAG
ncbi:ferritin-like domain-containing protein [Streptomyces sp. ET3-23]|uniref:ferritin-like domain-containing protein n=1 Tax=Streptomyces sp. ET3-23 TaxID=2885643 RepID=UPI001D1085CF|nr:ferritin-like domain-containing protein [Streptomyces sp. ET3-23]MCC2280900.1 ferritin-like domain-containing protein [Streptomyces sp. ET3-23]